MEDDINTSSVTEIAALARESALIQYPQVEGSIPLVVVPEGSKVVGLKDLTDTDRAPRPIRAKGKIQVFDAESFCDYYQQFADPESRMFADESQAKILGVLDYHQGNTEARWCQHQVLLTLRFSEEWKVWKGKNGVANKMGQVEFSEFLEDNAPDIVEPKAATMLECARGLSAKSDVTFESAIRMANGQVKLQFNESVKGTFGSGNMEVPELFTLGIPVYLGQPRVEIQARLRYRIAGGKLSFWYDLLRPGVFEREGFLNMRSTIAQTTGQSVLNGVPDLK